MRSRRLVAVIVLGPAIGAVVLACAPRAPVASDDGWSPKLAPVSAVDASEPPAPVANGLAAELADASVEDLTAAFQKRTTRVAPARWRIQREAFELLFLDGSRVLATSCRLVPEPADGSIVGMRLFGVRKSSVAGLLGAQNGDRLETLNGLPLTRPDQVLALHAVLSNARRIDLVVVRNGRPLTLTYDVVDAAP